jgi:carbon-monoxide dehydrogenase medium subunit
VTLSALLESQLIADHAPVLRQAAAVFANPLVRNRATLGGNLGDASPAADTAPALLVLDAEVILESLNGGMRTIAIDDFFVGVRKTARRPDELITAVRLPILPAHSAANFYKLGLRKADAISVVGVAVRLTRDEAGHCTAARIALGSVAPRPLRAHAAEELLIGKPLTAEAIAEAARMAAEAASPISDVRASADYRRHTAGVLARRLLAQAADQIQ